ncbi:nudix hydrolase 15, mitochondrial-like [Abrus precatorius]|uniref:Nudix hydrolase 15, mitochondrial-like n=1 Tax=Abrus precatorius TaxID=3816 RepID=A0A8B8K342_ABRPR|nr:nudix hydrolase 15, mitochondrial-like [Abrus precatorius]
MGSSNSNAGSQGLLALAQRLRLYKPPPFPEDILDQIMEENGGKVVSQVSYQESTIPIAQNTAKLRYKRAAVLICIFEGDAGDLRVILTKRSSKLSTYSGEVALPGGKEEEGDKDDGHTAKREAMEEIGLDPELVDVVAVLEPFFSKYLMRVVPVIGILHDRKAFKPVLNPAEVEVVFDAPLEMFLKDENRSQEKIQWMGENYLVHLFDYEIENKKYLIWGLTAGILIRAASVVYQRPPAFMEQNRIFKVPRDLTKDTVMH